MSHANEAKRECFARSGIYERLPIALDRKSNIYIWKAIKTPNEIPSSLRSSVLLVQSAMPTFTRKTSTAHRENSRLVTALIHWRCSAQDDTVVVRRSRHCYAMPPSLGSGSTGEFTSLLSDDTLFLALRSFSVMTRCFFALCAYILIVLPARLNPSPKSPAFGKASP